MLGQFENQEGGGASMNVVGIIAESFYSATYGLSNIPSNITVDCKY